MKPLTPAILATLLGTALLASCANPVPIAQSSQADAAKVRFVDRTGSDAAWIRLYPQTECNAGATVIDSSRSVLRPAPQAPQRVNMLAAVDAADSNAQEYAFAAGQRINIGAGVDRQPRHLSCLGGASFVARPSLQYEVVLANSASGQCRLEVSTLQAQPGGVVTRQPAQELQPFVCKGMGR